MKVGGVALRLGVFALVMLAVLGLVFTLIKRPVSGDTEAHDALFTDANGLKVGNDVRMFGVQVGKIEKISLEGDKAKVHLTVKTDTPIYDNSKLAIRYQNLTGQRYIDLQQAPNPGKRIAADARIGANMTVPSFDVTSLFSGLKPVLATLSPEAINQFTASMLAVIEGDGSGLGPALTAIDQLASYAEDRQHVVNTLISNLSTLGDRHGGRVGYLLPLLARLTDIFEAMQRNIGGVAQFAMTAPSVLAPVDRLLASLGLVEGGSAEVDAMIRGLFPNPQEAVDVFGRLPGLLATVDASLSRDFAGFTPTCSNGPAEVPAPLQVLIAGQKVTVCNA
ncbi:MlaD family protein [Nocardia rhizosphaerihabitans]|uniref:Mce family protein n=1 Tax=Nocardia rhizosphaerihabitans TaxID=1691570 RepID=A0ABQ2L595_9NOCA|nr:MlaD family protein [Nocardia rhizosphaerihabitans]GGO00441.1 putative Mce family protein [Nocardia rhizosphaerihabitans]